MLSLEAAGRLVDEVKHAATATLPSLELTVVVEGQTRPSDLVERIHAAAARKRRRSRPAQRDRGTRSDGSLHLTMHAKLPGDMTLATAARAQRRPREALRAELPDATRVDIHLEPWSRTSAWRRRDNRNAQLTAQDARGRRRSPEVRRSLTSS